MANVIAATPRRAAISGPARRRIDACCIGWSPPASKGVQVWACGQGLDVRMAAMKTKSELLKAARARVTEVTPAEVARQSPKPVLVDVREKQETDQGILPGAKILPRGFLELRIEEAVPDHDADVVLYCAGGTRSLLAGRTLQDMGYTRVRSMAGGYGAWKDAGLPVETPVRLSEAQRSRYSRHLLIPEVGELGQAKLLKSKVLLIGAGGLGSPAAY